MLQFNSYICFVYLLVCFEGGGHVLRESIDEEDNNPSKKRTNIDPQCKGHKATTSRLLLHKRSKYLVYVA